MVFAAASLASLVAFGGIAAAAAAAPAAGDAPKFAPCATAPKGMVCVAGGAAVVGSDDVPNEKPKRTVQLSTFYIDAHEATFADWEACAKDQACAARKGDAGASVLGVDYASAVKFCTWAGKRLPTEWEWEKAARGESGDAAEWTAEKPKKKGEAAAPVPAKTAGVFDMGGNFEWTSSWLGILGHKKGPAGDDGKPTDEVTPRGDKDGCQDCEGIDPRGPCDGESPCTDGGGKKIVRGGGFTLPKVGAAHRRAVWPNTAEANIGVRCATSEPVLTRFPSKVATEKRPRPAAPTQPTAEQLKQFADVTEDKLDTQLCEKKGRAFLDCRDPNSYIKSNEPRQQVWRPYIENLGGGYTGVGIDQNYTFIAAAHSEWAWLFDYDPTVVRLHWILRAVILQSPDRGSFVDHFGAKKADETLKLLDDAYKDNPELPAYKEIYKVSRASLEKYYKTQLTGEGGDATFGWLATDDNYGYIRTLYQQGRIRAFKGNMLDKNTMQGIGAAAKKMGVTIRVYYPSNAPECWPFTKEYKDNVAGLPFDKETVVLQTISGLAPGYMKLTGHWHYNVQAGLMQQELIRRKGTVLAKQLMEYRNRTQDPDLTITGLPGIEN